MATITGTLKNSSGVTYTGSVRFEPYPNKDVRYVSGSTLTAATVTSTVTGGVLSVTLAQGVYTVTQDDTNPWRINVPAGAGSYNIETLTIDTGNGGMPPITLFSVEDRFFVDTFNRVDTDAGENIGPPDLSIDGAAWGQGGPAGVSWPLFDASEDVYLLDGEVRTTIGKTLYLYRDYVHKPREIGVRVKWYEGNVPLSANYTSLAISLTANTSGSYVTNFIHCQVSRREMTIQSGPTVSTLRTHARAVFDAVLDEKLSLNEEYVVTFRLEGGLATLNCGDRTIQCDIGQVAEYHGSRGYIEIYSPNASANDDMAILSTWCGNNDSVPIESAGYAPRHASPRVRELKFPGTTCHATVTTTGVLGDITGSDYSLYFRGTTPMDNREMPSGGGLLSINGRPLAENWGQGPTLRLMTNYGGGEGSWALEHSMANGSDTRTARWGNRLQAQRVAGRQFDVMVTRSVPLSTTTCYWDGEFQPVEGDVEVGTPPAWSLTFAADDYIHVGQAGSTSNLGWTGGVQVAAVANCVLDDYDMALMRRGVIPERRKWATGTALTTGTLTVGRCYRLGAVGTPNYYYTGCTVGDEIHVITAAKAILITRGGVRYGDLKTLLTTTINGSNTVTQTGFLVWLDADAGNPNQMVDLSSNRLHAAFTGAIVPSTPEFCTVPFIMADTGDADITLSQTGYPEVIVPYETELTGNKAVTLPTAGAFVGQRITVARNAATPGAYTLAVAALKTIPSGTNAVVQVLWAGAAWKLSGYQAL